MASLLSTAIDACFISQSSDTKRQSFFPNPKPSPLRRCRTKRLTISCNSSKPAKTLEEYPLTGAKSPSLSEQLKSLSATTLKPDQTHVLSKPKSVWVNPARPKRSVLSLQRHKRSSYSYNPQLQDLKAFAQKLNSSEFTENSEFLAVLDEIPHPLTRDNALLVLNSLRPWQKTHLFFGWMKAQNLFPIETIFYNVTMKSLRFGRQFQLIEELALEMVRDGVELDNITYSTIITCAKRCSLYDKAIEWFERMYKTGLMPDEVTYSSVLDVYAKLGKVEEVLSLYERAVATGWKPDPLTFSVLGKMFGEAGDYDGIRYVLQEMKSMDVKPNVVVYNTLLEAMGKAKKPGLARSLFNEMLESGLTPNEITLTALVKIYGKARWEKDALQLWKEMKARNWPMDFILYNTLLNMCADIGLEEEAETLFCDMKQSMQSKPDSFSYTAMLNIYGSGGKVDKAMALFEEMLEAGVQLNVMGCTCLIQCLGKARRINDLVKVFNLSIQRGVKPDDRLCGCLLSVVALCETSEDTDKVMACLEKANLKLISFVKLIMDEKTGFETVKEEFRSVISETQVEARRPFCNCLIDICRNKNHHERARELLYLGTLFGLYPGLHNKTLKEWSLDVRSLSIGAAETALEEWMRTLATIVRRQEDLPERFLAQTGMGTHKFAQGLGNSFSSHLEKLSVPFRPCQEKAGRFVATRDDLVFWLESKFQPLVASQA
ncbi:PREDICTED: pentatricopeptide repeat-containing protein At5g46580, chloroplastic [Tarenaya hassleriana]|uniref:pentatricopeptide repeat-containing protein At5g46580, chloroplastic n=1 Tax=Tarenaya hassleriana TaxID=28532 RepID=UPI00053C212D|nr:PREDICTED: pentatricopeptide repeat-containing protein At5g46580, chloroplastic [Tarenaya hassleriana]